MTLDAELLGDYLRLSARTLTEDAVMAILVAAAVVVLGIGVLGKVLELKYKRAAQTIAVQGEIADSLLQHPALLGFPLTPTARVPLWRGSPVTVKVVGVVPSRELRALALRAAERGAADLLVVVRIKSSIRVVKSARARKVEPYGIGRENSI